MIPETNFSVTDADIVISAVQNTYSDLPADTLDGLSITGEDWWLNLRKSNTEPLIRLNVEASSKETLSEVVETVSKLASK